MKHRILIHSPHLSTPGGKQTYFSSLKDHFQNDIEFFFYGAKGKKESKISVIGRLLSDFWRFYRILKKEDFCLVHLNPSLNPKSFFRDSIFALICTLTNTKMTVFWHGWQWSFEKKVVQKIQPWFRLSYGKADSMIVLAKEFSAQLKKYHYKNSVYQVTTVADPMFFQSRLKIENQSIKNPLKEDLTLLFLSRIEAAKGIYETLDSFEVLKQDFPFLKLKIAGSGKELDTVGAYVLKKKLQDVELTGWITGKEKVKAFSDSDIYILPSYSEGLPCSILEAMAMGLPVVSTDVGGIKDLFQEELMGYIVEMKSATSITEKLRLLLNNPDKIVSIGNYNFEYAKKHFTPEKVSFNLERIYAETIKA